MRRSKSSYTASWQYTTRVEVHLWPAVPVVPKRQDSTAWVTSASECTTTALFPPSSRSVRVMLGATACSSATPIFSPPVASHIPTRGSVHMRSTRFLSTMSMQHTSPENPRFSSTVSTTRVIAMALSTASGCGFHTTPFPVARAGSAPQPKGAYGKLNAVTLPTMPRGNDRSSPYQPSSRLVESLELYWRVTWVWSPPHSAARASIDCATSNISTNSPTLSDGTFPISSVSRLARLSVLCLIFSVISITIATRSSPVSLAHRRCASCMRVSEASMCAH
mmetsp:Transcript_40481/g.64946  ORF Transcript_40481/g.64946 Transcript_40481/m.64946 type:complete len:278 (-) Transcript_40481:449-1282(-)